MRTQEIARMKAPRSKMLALGALALPLAQAAEGRWEGAAQVPGLVVPVVIDLARDGVEWVGAATLPGRGVAAVPLRALEVGADGSVRATLAPGAGGAPGGEVRVALRRSADGRALDGQWRQGGHGAPLSLRRTGSAQRAAALAADPLAPALAGTWRGQYDIGFGKRDVTLRIAPPGATMTIVGRRTTELTFDDVRQVGGLLMLRSSEMDVTLEAPWSTAAQGLLAATWIQGPFESALPLQREGQP
jgi:hypothetical protein